MYSGPARDRRGSGLSGYEPAELGSRGGVVTQQRREQENKIEIHPAAALLPDPTTGEYERLKEDIRKNGLRVPVVLTADDRILDGRSRHRACQELGITMTSRTTTMTEETNPIGFVLSMNAARRHLARDQLVALYLVHNADTIEADQKAAQAAQQANLKKGNARELPVKPSGKTSAKIAKATGVSRSTVERVQKVVKKAPERLEDVATGKVSAIKVLEEIAPSEQPTAEDTYLTEIVTGSKRTMAAIKLTVKERRAVNPEVLDKAQEALRKVLAALETLAPRWTCTECDHVLDVGEEPDSKWECSNEQCGNTWVGDRQCDSCGKTFSRKELDHACPECEGEMEMVAWETVKEAPEPLTAPADGGATA